MTGLGGTMLPASETDEADARRAKDDSAAGLVSGRRSDGTMASGDEIARIEAPGLGRMTVKPDGTLAPETAADNPTRRDPRAELAAQLREREGK